MKDITYCVNSGCPFVDCKKHPEHIDKNQEYVKLAAFDSVCRKYIAYLVEVISGE